METHQNWKVLITLSLGRSMSSYQPKVRITVSRNKVAFIRQNRGYNNNMGKKIFNFANFQRFIFRI